MTNDTWIASAVAILSFIAAVVATYFAIRKSGEKSQKKETDLEGLAEKYIQCCEDIASIKKEMLINSKATDAALVLVTEKMTNIALTYGQKIAWLEAKVNGMGEKHGG